jgi:hypothetical protein
MGRAVAIFCALAAAPSFGATANPVVADVFQRAPIVVYELPELDGRTEAIRYVESIRDRFKKGTEVIDAGAKEAVLKGKLKNGFVLYTTLGEESKLLRLATRELGWQVAGGTFRWRDVAAPAREVRFILAGRNPYGKGYCAIYAAGSNGALAGMNDPPQGRSSYQLFRNGALLREGDYDGHFVSRERVSQAAALEDANQFFKTLERVHPHLLARVSAEEFRKLKEQTAAGIASKLDASGQIAVDELASLLYYAGAYFKDGHTSVHWEASLNEWNTRGKRFPAFRLAFDNGRFVIAAAKDRNLTGLEVVAVNGAPVLEFLKPILDRCSGETPAFRAARLIGNASFWYYLTNLFGAETEYRLKLRDAEGESHEALLETLSYADYRAFRGGEGVEPFHPNSEGTKVEFFDSGATAHLMYPAFYLSAEEKKKIDGIFEEVKAKGARNLILDLRGNGGGASPMGDYLFRYLYDGKFRSIRQVRVKPSWDILPEVPWWARPIVFVLRGRTMSHSIAEQSAPKPAAFFPGRAYLLIDNASYSMATEFAAMFRDYDLGTILGYETGGLPATFGGPHRFVLKNSRIPCGVAWTELLPAKPWPGDDEHGVIPNVPLDGGKLAGFHGERDPVLAFTLHYIKTGATPR